MNKIINTLVIGGGGREDAIYSKHFAKAPAAGSFMAGLAMAAHQM